MFIAENLKIQRTKMERKLICNLPLLREQRSIFHCMPFKSFFYFPSLPPSCTHTDLSFYLAHSTHCLQSVFFLPHYDVISFFICTSGWPSLYFEEQLSTLFMGMSNPIEDIWSDSTSVASDIEDESRGVILFWLWIVVLFLAFGRELLIEMNTLPQEWLFTKWLVK